MRCLRKCGISANRAPNPSRDHAPTGGAQGPRWENGRAAYSGDCESGASSRLSSSSTDAGLRSGPYQRPGIRADGSRESTATMTGDGRGLAARFPRLRGLLHLVALLHNLCPGRRVADRISPGATSNTQQDGQHGRYQGHPQRSLGNLMQFSVLLLAPSPSSQSSSRYGATTRSPYIEL